MLLIPYRLDSIFTRIPVTNAAIVALTSLIFFFIPLSIIPSDVAASFVLRDWNLGEMVGSLFLHGGFFHLLGNMLFLFVFGNAICSAVGNAAYLFIYLFLGICASASHLLFSGGPAVGASGAINGIVGMVLVLYPVNKLHCFYFFFFPFAGWVKTGTFEIKCFWMIGLWFIFDILGAMIGAGHVAYWAHIGGFVVGVLIGLCLLAFKLVETFGPTLLTVFAGEGTDTTMYDLQDLRSMSTPKKTTWDTSVESSHDEWVKGFGGETHSSVETAVASTSKPSSEPYIAFRVLRLMQANDDLTCYFVNEGDDLEEVSLETSEGLTGEIQPSQSLPKKVPGWIKLHNLDQKKLEGLKVSISYRSSVGSRSHQFLTYRASQRIFAGDDHQ